MEPNSLLILIILLLVACTGTYFLGYRDGKEKRIKREKEDFVLINIKTGQIKEYKFQCIIPAHLYTKEVSTSVVYDKYVREMRPAGERYRQMLPPNWIDGFDGDDEERRQLSANYREEMDRVYREYKKVQVPVMANALLGMILNR